MSIGPTVHGDPVQSSESRFVAPAGVVLSGTCEAPPPSERFPQMRFLSAVVPARSRKVPPQAPLPAVDVKSNWVGGPPAVVLVDEVVVGVAVVDVELELDVDDDDDVDVVGASVELVVDDVGATVVVEEVVGPTVVVDEEVVGTVDVEEEVVGVEELVVVGTTQVHCSEQMEPSGQLKAPPGELGSHGSPSSTMPLPQSDGMLVLVVVEVVVVAGRDEVDDVVEVLVVAGRDEVDDVVVTVEVVTEVDVVGGVVRQDGRSRNTRSVFTWRA